MLVTLDEAKMYLRVDSAYEDDLISSLLASSEKLCMDVGRLSAEEWDTISAYTSESMDSTTVRSEEVSAAEVLRMKEVLKVGVLYALGYLYEHREEANHHELVLTLRSILFSIREGVL